jgi:hypothetical protein
MNMNDLKNHLCDRDDREAQYDGYGIFLTYTCYKCHKSKMSGFRADIMEPYECDEPIEEDE